MRWIALAGMRRGDVGVWSWIGEGMLYFRQCVRLMGKMGKPADSGDEEVRFGVIGLVREEGYSMKLRALGKIGWDGRL